MSSFHPSPPIFCSHIWAPPGLSTYTLYHTLLFLTPSAPAPLPPSPISSDIYSACCKAMPITYCCKWFCALSKGTLWLPRVGLDWPWSPPDLLQIIAEIYLAVFIITVSVGTLWCCIRDFSSAMVAIVSHIAQNVGMALGVFRVLVNCPLSGV